MWNAQGYGPFAAIDRRNGKFRGRINLQRRADTDEIEIGWIFERGSWGQGLATEAVRAVLAWCFQVLDISCIVACIEPSNERSHRVADRLGMTLLRSGTSDGGVEQVFAIPRGRWRRGNPPLPPDDPFRD
jgi:RimJ/RimL family protein N-acetyltransferase